MTQNKKLDLGALAVLYLLETELNLIDCERRQEESPPLDLLPCYYIELYNDDESIGYYQMILNENEQFGVAIVNDRLMSLEEACQSFLYDTCKSKTFSATITTSFLQGSITYTKSMTPFELIKIVRAGIERNDANSKAIEEALQYLSCYVWQQSNTTGQTNGN